MHEGHLVDIAGPRVSIAGGLLFLAIAMGLTAAIGSNVLGGADSAAPATVMSNNGSGLPIGDLNTSTGNLFTAAVPGSGSGSDGLPDSGHGHPPPPTAVPAHLLGMRWQLWVIYGTICGIAFGALNLNVFATAVVKLMPPHMHASAVGIATSGSTFGQLALVPLFSLISRTYGWRVGYGCLSAACLLIIPFALRLLRPRPDLELPPLDDDADDHADGEHSSDANDSKEDEPVAEFGFGDGADWKEQLQAGQPAAEAVPLRAKLKSIAKSRVNWVITFAFVYVPHVLLYTVQRAPA